MHGALGSIGQNRLETHGVRQGDIRIFGDPFSFIADNLFIVTHNHDADLKPLIMILQNNFERAQVDMFVVKGTDIGDIQRVVVWHDNSGPGPAWHLQQVCNYYVHITLSGYR